MSNVDKKPAFSLARIVKQRDAIASALLPYVDGNICGTVFHDLFEDVLEKLPDTISYGALFESLRCLAGCQLTKKTAGEWAWRLAGNVRQLVDNKPVTPWTRQISDELMPVRVERVLADKKREINGYTFFCRVLAGSACPIIFPQFLNNRSCMAVARAVGFTAPWGNMPYTNGLHFADLIFYAHVEAEKSRETPYFRKISATSSMIKHNRERLELRCRSKPCPRGYSHDCHVCHIGYDQCVGGVFPQTLVEQHCKKCGDTNFVPPTDNLNICYNCGKSSS